MILVTTAGKVGAEASAGASRNREWPDRIGPRLHAPQKQRYMQNFLVMARGIAEAQSFDSPVGVWALLRHGLRWSW